MSWEQLRSIASQGRQEREYWESQPPRACPNDGTPLVTLPGGGLGCPFDGWQYPRDWDPVAHAGM